MLYVKKEITRKQLTQFCMEVKKEKGEECSTLALYEIVCSIQSFTENRSRHINFFEKPASTFQSLKRTLDGLLREEIELGSEYGCISF